MTDAMSILRRVLAGDLGALDDLRACDVEAVVAAAEHPDAPVLRPSAVASVVKRYVDGQASQGRVQRWAAFMRWGYVRPGERPARAVDIEYDPEYEYDINEVIGRLDELGDVIDGELRDGEAAQMISLLSREPYFEFVQDEEVAATLRRVLSGDVRALDRLARFGPHVVSALLEGPGAPVLSVGAVVSVVRGYAGGQLPQDQVQRWAAFMRWGYFGGPGAPKDAVAVEYDPRREFDINEVIGRLDELGDLIDGELREGEAEEMIRILLAEPTRPQSLG